MKYPIKETLSSNFLEMRLQQVIERQEFVENTFREKHVNQWTVMFCDVSKILTRVESLKSKDRYSLINEYRSICIEILKQYNPPFLSKIEGPQILACFVEAQQACDAAIAIQNAIHVWSQQNDDHKNFIPAIGLHTGELVVKDDDLKQSNACNLGKRIQTEAKSGDIYLSAETCKLIKPLKIYDLKYVKITEVKNIPDPQVIYCLNWKSSKNEYKRISTPSYSSRRTTKKEKVIEGYMGILICDVAGSSRKFWNLGDLEGNMLIEMYRKEVFPSLIRHKACCIDNSEGDQIIAIFPEDSIEKAAFAAIEIQRYLFRRNSNSNQWYRHKLNVSIGIHCGELTVRNNKVVYNDTFYTAKTIQEEADENEIFVSGYMQQYLEHLPNVVLEKVGEASPKGIKQDVSVYALQWHKSGL